MKQLLYFLIGFVIPLLFFSASYAGQCPDTAVGPGYTVSTDGSYEVHFVGIFYGSNARNEAESYIYSQSAGGNYGNYNDSGTNVSEFTVTFTDGSYNYTAKQAGNYSSSPVMWAIYTALTDIETVCSGNDVSNDDDDDDGILNKCDTNHPDYDTFDCDGDGILNSSDLDDDGNGISDFTDPNHPSYDPYHDGSDFDGDGIINGFDSDVDGDGILNDEDPDPWSQNGTGTDDETSSNDYSGILSSIRSDTNSIKNSAIGINSKVSSINSSLNTANSTLTQIQSDTNQIKTGIDTANTKLTDIGTGINSVKSNTNLTNQNLSIISDHLSLSEGHLSNINDGIAALPTADEIGQAVGTHLDIPTSDEIGQAVKDQLIDSSQTIDTAITDNISSLDKTETLTAINTKYSGRFDSFITTLKGSDLFSLPFGIFSGPSGSGSSIQTVNIGKWGSSTDQSATIDYSDYDNIWDVLRSVFLLLTSFSCFKILVLKKG